MRGFSAIGPPHTVDWCVDLFLRVGSLLLFVVSVGYCELVAFVSHCGLIIVRWSLYVAVSQDNFFFVQ